MNVLKKSLLACFLFVASMTQAAELSALVPKLKWVKQVNKAAGYSLEMPKFWQGWPGMADGENYTDVFVGIKGKKICGVCVMVGPADTAGDFDMDDLGPMSMITGGNTELEVMDWDMIEINEQPMQVLYAQIRNLDTKMYLELEIYRGEFGDRANTIVYFVCPAYYAEAKPLIDRSVNTFTWQ